MKTIALLVICGVLATTVTAEPMASQGDSVASVLKEMGTPRGHLRYDDTEILLYDTARIEAKGGVVTRAQALQEEAAPTPRTVVKSGDDWMEGATLKARKLLDPNFVSASAADRLAFWTAFRQRYPNVSVDEEYTATHRDWQVEQRAQVEARQQEHRISELEQRVAAAEATARDAERRVRRSTINETVYVYQPAPVVSYNTYRPGISVSGSWGYPSVAVQPIYGGCRPPLRPHASHYSGNRHSHKTTPRPALYNSGSVLSFRL